MIQVPESMRTPGFANRFMRPTEAQKRIRSAIQANAAVRDEAMAEYFGYLEEQQQKQFKEKYNFDPVKEEPLPGRYDWVKLKP